MARIAHPHRRSSGQSTTFRMAQTRHGFTLIEILVVLGIIAFLASALGVTISNFLTMAREGQTTATLTKIDGLIVERQQGLTRLFESRDFLRTVDDVHEQLKEGDPANGIPQLIGLAPDFVHAMGKKHLARDFFPQRFAEMTDTRQAASAGNPRGLGSDGIPDRVQFDEVFGTTAVTWGVDPSDSVLKPFKDLNGNGTPDATDSFHTPVTESAELLYFALTRMQVFGVAPVGVDAFLEQEIADTDNDGLPEFVDAWGNPLRFYRWPTRLIKPFGQYGYDQAPGVAGTDDDDADNDSSTGVDDLWDIGWPGSDDTFIPKEVRQFASLYIAGLPREPILVPSGTGGPPSPVAGDFDQLNVDGDDPFGIMLDEAKRLTATGISVLTAASESRYHTFDTYHRPLVVSAGPDGNLGLLEPFANEDTFPFNGILDAGEDTNGNGYLDIGWLAQPLDEDYTFTTYSSTGNTVWNGDSSDTTTGDINGNVAVDSIVTPIAALDDLTNRNQGGGN